ncbi:hypothetical protein BC940DRAFT_297660 [Gongronella butleri]|nr:hypothetical protein BC940DRAFT_297660 [Gongronella butleri]
MFFCLIFGFDKLRRKSGKQVYVCPNCSAADVYHVKTNDCFTFCFIPLIPCGGTKEYYECFTCGRVNVYAPMPYAPANHAPPPKR